MNSYVKSIPLGAVLVLALSSVSAQTPAPMGAASAATTVGVTPQEAATATQKAVPRSDTATLVNTAPTAADKARSVMNNNNALNSNSATTAEPMASTTGDRAMTTKRRPARADRN